MGGVSQDYFDRVYDEQFSTVKTIDVTHDLNHKGLLFTTGHYHANVANNGYCDMRIANSQDKELAVIWLVNAEGKAIATLYLGPTVTTEEELPVYPLVKYPSVPASMVKSYHVTALADAGTQALPSEMILGGIGPQSTGAGHEDKYELLIPPGYSLLLRVQNVSGQTKDINTKFRWTEYDSVYFSL